MRGQFYDYLGKTFLSYQCRLRKDFNIQIAFLAMTN